ncbi:MAG: ABC transporter ATP-binding protein [Anaerolineaceae bacterium]|nr:ABC transporter ATP-binding protein [Anaerolineaceae bacterium]
MISSSAVTVDAPVRESGEIVFERVSKSFATNTYPAVDQVSVKITACDLVVLLGPSGCGKTTLLKMVNRLYEPDSGKIWMGGKEIHTLPVNELRRQIGYVIQQVGLFPHMTIQKNISVVPHLLGWQEKRINDRLEMLMELIGLPVSYLPRYPRQLSGGEQQRVGLARALAADPEILLMDEPFAAVDAINRERLQSELIDLHSKLNKTILFVTHDVEEAFRLANKIIVMRAGKLVQYGTPLELVTQPENEFIEDLVGSSNILRKLSLVNVNSILKARKNQSIYSGGSQPVEKPNTVLRPEDDLRSVVSLLLCSGKDSLPVKDSVGHLLGTVGYADLREMLISNLPSE